MTIYNADQSQIVMLVTPEELRMLHDAMLGFLVWNAEAQSLTNSIDEAVTMNRGVGAA